MRRVGCLILCTLAAVTVITACRQFMPTNRYLQPRRSPLISSSTRDALGRFNHPLHASILAAHEITCADCHRFDVRIDTSNDQMARELSSMSQIPRSTPCHFCHIEHDTRVAAAPSACTTCHQNILPLRPPNHDVAWLKVHGTVAPGEPTQCESCHKPAYCINCHEARDTIQTVMHDRNYLTYHSVDARANPMQCGNCHRPDYCSNCHAQGKPNLPPQTKPSLSR